MIKLNYSHRFLPFTSILFSFAKFNLLVVIFISYTGLSKRTAQRRRALALKALGFCDQKQSQASDEPERDSDNQAQEATCSIESIDNPVQGAAANRNVLTGGAPCIQLNNPYRDLSHFPDVLANCDLSEGISLEQDFLKIVVARNLGRTITNDFLSMFRKHNIGHFAKDARSMLGTLRKVVSLEMSHGRYFHFGLCEMLNRALVFASIDSNVVKIQINIDGLPISKSSNRTFWPILGKVVFPVVSKVFIIGLYCGEKKPGSVHQYLKSFIKDALAGFNTGFFVNGKLCQVIIDSVVCDAPARQFMKRCKTHGGYYACERCEVKGLNYEGSRRYRNLDCPLRTDESFRNRKQPGHHVGKKPTPFCKIPYIDLIRHFPLDYMHLVLLGVVRTLLKSWLTFTSDGYSCKVSKKNFSRMSLRNRSFAKSAPDEFQRKPRSFSFLPKFKATEIRMFLCYTSPAVLSRMFPKVVYYQHFMLLVVAMRILLAPNQPAESVNFARLCLRNFVEASERYYDLKIYVYNYHSLVHLADDYETYGYLDRISSFPFESYLGKLKDLIKRSGKELEQVVNRLHEQQNILESCEIIENRSDVKLNCLHFDGPLGMYDNRDEIVFQYSEITYRGRFFRLKSSNDVVCWKGCYCRIVNILQIGKNVYFLLKQFVDCKDVFFYPVRSSAVGIVYVGKSLKSPVFNVHVSEVEKCWFTEWNNNVDYVVKMLHEIK